MIQGEFKNELNETIKVQILNNHNTLITIGDDESYDLCWTDQPVVINAEDGDIDECLISKKCTIKLMTSIDLYDYVFYDNPWDCRVVITNKTKGRILFYGYVVPMNYNQDFSRKWNEISIECTDYIGTLQYKPYLNDDWKTAVQSSGIKSFKDIIVNIFSNYRDLEGNLVPVVMLHNFNESGYLTNNLEKNINDFILCGETEEDQQNCDYALNTILTFLGLKIATIIDSNGTETIEHIAIYDPENLGLKFTQGFIYAKDLREPNTNYVYRRTCTDYIKLDDENGYVGGQYDITIEQPVTKLKVEVEREKAENIIPSLFDDGIEAQYPHEEPCIVEYCTVNDLYGNVLTTLLEHRRVDGKYNPFMLNYINDRSAWTRRWWFRKLRSEGWDFYDKFGHYEYDFTPLVNQTQYLSKSWGNEGDPTALNPFPIIFDIKAEDKIKKNQNSSEVKTSTARLLMIPINGNGNDEWGHRAPNYDDLITQNTGCMIHYHSSTEINLSPVDDKTTNYLIFSGKMGYSPRERTSYMEHRGTYNGQPVQTTNEYNTTFERILHPGTYEELGVFSSFGWNTTNTITVPRSCLAYGWINKDDGRRFYAQSFLYNDQEEATTDFFYFPMLEDADKTDKKFKYNYCQSGTDNNEKIEKVSVLICSLVVGEGNDAKILNETFVEDGNGIKQSHFEWLAATDYPDATFTLGFEPKQNECVIGTYYDLENNISVDNKISGKGMAIPITKDDALHGPIDFKIIRLVDNIYLSNGKIKRDLSNATAPQASDSKFILSHASALFIKSLKVAIESDVDADVLNAKDLVYVSDNSQTYVKNEKSISFNICTGLTQAESDELKVENDVYTNVIYNNDQQKSVATYLLDKDNNQRKAEEIFIQKYYDKLSAITKVYRFTIPDLSENYPRNYGSFLGTPHFSIYNDGVADTELLKIKSLEYDVRTNLLTLEGTKIE